MLRETVLNIFGNIWPMLVIVLVILITLRFCYLRKNNIKLVLYKDIIMLGFIIYVLCLFHVVTFQDVSWSTSNYIPFKEMLRYEFGSRLFLRNVVGNMLMFVPFGFFVSHILKTDKMRYSLLLSIILSCTIEVIQLLIGRVFDIDDIILNVIGGIVGFLIYNFADKMRDKLPNSLKKPWFYNIITLLLVFVMILYLLNIIEVGI